jgi:RNA polymerase sigma-70 factor (ECF subfamily)
MFPKDAPDQIEPLGSLRDLPDADVVRQLVAGNDDAMAVIFDRYYRLAMNVALRIVRDAGEAQDVVQIAFLDFYRQAKFFDPAKGSLKGWLLQYFYGRSINRKESLKSRNFYGHVELESDYPITNESRRIFDLESPEAARLIEQILATLSEQQRAVIEKICFQGLTLAETAAATGDSFGNVQHTYYRGIEKLRTYLRDADNQTKCGSEAKYRVSLFRGLRKVAKEMKNAEVEIVKARAL